METGPFLQHNFIMDTDSEYALDSLISGTSSSGDGLSNPLSYPSKGPEETQSASETPSRPLPPQLCKDRIYVGNLHPSVDEYTLFQVFSKFGKVIDLDFLFHKSGPLKGKPRGYAFVKYGDESDAQKAMSAAHDKPLRGRKIVVTYAHHAPLELPGGNSGGKGRRTMMEVGRPTTLSLLKSGSASRPMGTAARIAKMEAKLRQLEGASAAAASNSKPLHPSLPPKPQTSPLGVSSSSSAPKRPNNSSTPLVHTRPSNPPPTLQKLGSLTSPPAISSTAPRLVKAKLLGVKIKSKEKDKVPAPAPAPSPPNAD